jgi:hypothetical protein
MRRRAEVVATSGRFAGRETAAGGDEVRAPTQRAPGLAAAAPAR